jgi:hypothetical protein
MSIKLSNVGKYIAYASDEKNHPQDVKNPRRLARLDPILSSAIL